MDLQEFKYRLEDATRAAKEKPKYIVMGALGFILVIAFIWVWWPSSLPSRSSATADALKKLEQENAANAEPAPQPGPVAVERGSRRKPTTSK